MGLVQQEWVGQSRGKMPLPRFYWQPWERLLWEAFRGSGILPRFLNPSRLEGAPTDAL